MTRLADQLDEWVGEGLIAPDQAIAIRDHEGRRHGTGGRIPLLSEAAGYLGAVLAIIGVGVMFEDVWSDLSVQGYLGLTLVVSLGLAVAGNAVRSRKDPAAQRLTSVLWALSAVGAGVAAGLFGDEYLTVSDEVEVILVGAVGTTYAAVLWRAHQRVLQHVALFCGVATLVAGVAAAALDDITAWNAGFTLFVLGIAWLAASLRDLIPPARAGMVLGSLAILIGSECMSFGDQRALGLVLALSAAVAMMAVAVAVEVPLLLGIGAVGIFIALPQVIFHFFGDSVGAPVALLLSGGALIGVAVTTVRLRREV